MPIVLSNVFYLENSDMQIIKRTYRKPAELHGHEFYEIEVILGGHGTQMLNGESCKLSRGSVTVLTPADFHEFKCENELSVMDIILSERCFVGEAAEHILETANSLYVKLDENHICDIEKIADLLESATKYSENVRANNTKMLLECIYSILDEEIDKKGKRNKETDNTSVGLAMRYVDLHFRDNPSLKQTANFIHQSPEYFCRSFKKGTGYYYTEYLNNRKIECAKLLLEKSVMSIAEICFACGFNSISNFIRVFKKITGKRPNEYRQRK